MKITACDFDGTLFCDGVVSEADLEAIANWRRSRSVFGIVTGRGWNTLLRDVKRFSIPYDLLTCNNGAMTYDEQAQDVYYAVLPEPVRVEVMDYSGMRASSQCVSFAGTAIFTHAGKTDCWIFKEHVFSRPLPVRVLHMPGLYQISLAYAGPGESAAWSEAFTEGCDENAGVYSNNIYIDTTTPDVDKAAGMMHLFELRRWGEAKEVFVIGDDMNDLSMIRHFNGHVVANVVPEVRDVASPVFLSVGQMLRERG